MKNERGDGDLIWIGFLVILMFILALYLLAFGFRCEIDDLEDWRNEVQIEATIEARITEDK